jgi:hypothetical protein
MDASERWVFFISGLAVTGSLFLLVWSLAS